MDYLEIIIKNVYQFQKYLTLSGYQAVSHIPQMLRKRDPFITVQLFEPMGEQSLKCDFRTEVKATLNAN